MTVVFRTWLAGMLLCTIFQTTLLASDDQFFTESVEPILRTHCYSCHSHAASEISGGLTLDWKNGWVRGGDRGPSIVPGDAENSLLIKAIRHQDPDLKMPGERLTDESIAVLVKWVQDGADDPRVVEPQTLTSADAADWWSLRPLVRPEIPNVTGVAHPVDRFVLSKLEKSGLTLSEPADRRTLIRRLSIDLLGIQPSPEDVDSFVADDAPNAYERLVDRLLASPAYGERWARHWMDTIHFADTHGFEHDALRPNAWRYRDYLIQSLNEDKPWDRFIREQLAADVFYPDEPRLIPALGFLGAGTYDHSAAATAVNAFENLDRDDMVTQTMSAFVSTTANCARCHAHKFDPVSQEDYYSLQAVFAGIGKGDIPFDEDAETGRQRNHWQAQLDAVGRMDSTVLLRPENEAIVARWESEQGPSANWQSLDIESFVSIDAASLTRCDDGSILSGGPRPDKETTAVQGTTKLNRVTAFRLDLLTDPSLPMNGPGRMDNGNLHLTEFEVQEFTANAPAPRRLSFRRATADFDQSDWTSSHAIDGNLTTAWGIHPQVGMPHFAVFELSEPLEVKPDTRFAVLLRQLHGRGHIIGRFSLSVTDSDASLASAVPREIDEVRKIPQDQRTADQRLRLAAFVLRQTGSEKLQSLPAPAKVFAAGRTAVNERGTITFADPRVIRVLRRGDLDKPGEEAPPGALSVITSLPGRFELSEVKNESLRRAALADWIADSQNPLTWRSIANRVWQYHFGKGLCDTPSDFGRMGGIPSHPELLDWMAIWLRDDSHGQLKSLHRVIVTSAAYRQTSTHRPEAAAIDTENRLLWKMNSHRLDADSLRDSVMAVSGTLDRAMGGPGVAHFLSTPGPQLTPVLDYTQFDWGTPGATRRSIYRIVWRGIQDPFMEALDFPDMGQLSPTRGFSASPLQSLVLWNNSFMLYNAEKLASRCETTGAATSTEQIVAAVRLCWLRNPLPQEVRELEALAANQGLSAVCRLLLNSGEFLFVE